MKVVDMNIKKFRILAIVPLMAAIIFFWGGVAQAGGGADFSLFTTRCDDFVTCSCNSKCELHVLATSVGAENDTIKLIFLDEDFVQFRVPDGDSRSFSQYIGTVPEFDGALKIDPLDNDASGNVMTGYISIRGAGASCVVTPLAQQGPDR